MILSTESCILLALGANPRGLHGTGIIAWVKRESRGHVTVNQGAIYPLLDELVARHVIERVPSNGEPNPHGGRPRQFVKITRAGVKELTFVRMALKALLKGTDEHSATHHRRSA